MRKRKETVLIIYLIESGHDIVDAPAEVETPRPSSPFFKTARSSIISEAARASSVRNSRPITRQNSKVIAGIHGKNK